MAFNSAIVEEISLRGIVFRITEERLESYFALLISAALFGAMHFANPNSS
nr:CPBP family intramembrane glutamic endopeptidase [uncultured Pontibacter sp.]